MRNFDDLESSILIMTCWIVYFTIFSYGLSMGLALGCSSLWALRLHTIIRCSHDLRKRAALLIFMNKFRNVCKTHTISRSSTHLVWETNQTKFIRPFLGCFSFRFNFISRIKLKVHTAKKFWVRQNIKAALHRVRERECCFYYWFYISITKNILALEIQLKKKKNFKITEFFRRSIVKIYFTRSPSFACYNGIHSGK